MNQAVQKILGLYESENAGVITNLSRILNHGYLKGTGKMVILPVDQGFEHGPFASFSQNESAFDPHYHFRLAIASGCNAYAAPLGFLRAGAHEFAGQIPLILKANNANSLLKSATAPEPAGTASVESALELGCSAIGWTIYPGSEKQNQMYEEVARLGEKARKYGLPVVIWAYPRGKGVSKQGETALDVVAYSAHIACQLGAHIVKVKPPSAHMENDKLKGETKANLSDRVACVLKSAFNGKRIVIFSGGPAKEKPAFLQEIKALAEGGAFGSIVGRNSFKRPFKEGVALLKEVMDIYKNSTTESRTDH